MMDDPFQRQHRANEIAQKKAVKQAMEDARQKAIQEKLDTAKHPKPEYKPYPMPRPFYR